MTLPMKLGHFYFIIISFHGISRNGQISQQQQQIEKTRLFSEKTRLFSEKTRASQYRARGPRRCTCIDYVSNVPTARRTGSLLHTCDRECFQAPKWALLPAIVVRSPPFCLPFRLAAYSHAFSFYCSRSKMLLFQFPTCLTQSVHLGYSFTDLW